jgi:hypothetical protein
MHEASRIGLTSRVKSILAVEAGGTVEASAARREGTRRREM